jgi:hypothetical protein
VRETFHDYVDEIEFGSGGEEMIEGVQLGDNVVVKCQTSTSKDYWILLCDKGLHMIQDYFTYGWGQEWLLGDCVIQGV